MYFVFNKITAAFIAVTLIASIVILFIPGFHIIPVFNGKIDAVTAKTLLNNFNFSQRFLLQLPVIIFIMLGFYIITRKKINTAFIIILCIADLFIATQFNMPVTIIGAKRFSE